MNFKLTLALNYQDLLTLNLTKTKYLIFNPHQKVNFNLLPSLTLAGQCLEEVSIFRYLGMISILAITFLVMIIFIIFVTSSLRLSNISKHCLISIYYSVI